MLSGEGGGTTEECREEGDKENAIPVSVHVGLVHATLRRDDRDATVVGGGDGFGQAVQFVTGPAASDQYHGFVVRSHLESVAAERGGCWVRVVCPVNAGVGRDGEMQFRGGGELRASFGSHGSPSHVWIITLSIVVIMTVVFLVTVAVAVMVDSERGGERGARRGYECQDSRHYQQGITSGSYRRSLGLHRTIEMTRLHQT